MYTTEFYYASPWRTIYDTVLNVAVIFCCCFFFFWNTWTINILFMFGIIIVSNRETFDDNDIYLYCTVFVYWTFRICDLLKSEYQNILLFKSYVRHFRLTFELKCLTGSIRFNEYIGFAIIIIYESSSISLDDMI